MNSMQLRWKLSKFFVQIHVFDLARLDVVDRAHFIYFASEKYAQF